MDDLSIVLRHWKRSKDTKLNLSEKGITILPQEIFSSTYSELLAQLEVLDLSGNKLSSLDDRLIGLPSLKFLNLANNQIISLPKWILKMGQLEVLNLSNNPLSSQFEALLKKECQSEPKLKPTL
jgi:Leucine-rich repeat (LRR) protein